jgi:hypothetical protein
MTDDMKNNSYDDAPPDSVLAAAIAALPRETESGTVLEERTVQLLRAQGVLTNTRRNSPKRWWLAAAAAVALFATGMATGQWLGARQSALALAAQQASLQGMSSLVQSTGEAYVSALAKLAENNGAPGAPGTAEARDVALQVLHQAANEVVRLAPNDPVAVRILQGLDHATAQQTSARETRRQIIWF